MKNKNTLINCLKKAFILLIFQLIIGKITAQERPIPVNNSIDNKDTGIIVCLVESMPEFNGGAKAMYKFLSENFFYPSDVGCVEGTIYIGFVIEIDGNISDVKIKRGIHKAFDEEALRVIKLMSGMWTCGYQNGKLTRVGFTLPVKIRLE